MGKTFAYIILMILAIFSINNAEVKGQTPMGGQILGPRWFTGLGGSLCMADSFCLAAGHIDSAYAKVIVYVFDGKSWAPYGNSIYSSATNDYFGQSISMPDRFHIAIGAPRDDSTGADAGSVSIFHFQNGTWHRRGQMLLGDSTNSLFGQRVYMCDSNTLAVSSHSYNGPAGNNSGLVRIFTWQDSIWVQKGGDILGSSIFERLGFSISMSDSDHIAISSPFKTINYSQQGEVKTYQWINGGWIQMGPALIGDSIAQNFGYSISMPNPTILAIGARGANFNGYGSGLVRVFDFVGNQWIQKGSDLLGDTISIFFGSAVDMSDSMHLAVSAPDDYTILGSGTGSGSAYRYTWQGNNWIQDGETIAATQIGEKLGSTLSMPHPDIVAVGSPFFDFGRGRISVYRFCDSVETSFGADSIISCGPYQWIDGNTYSFNNDSSTFILSNMKGCDSIVHLFLTIVEIDTLVDVTSPRLTSRDSVGNYQWLYCDSSYIPIPGANQRSYTATSNGRYAVVVEKNGCKDTSNCIQINDINLTKIEVDQFEVFPNPTSGSIHITAINSPFSFVLYSANGLPLFKGQSESEEMELSLSKLPQGVFILDLFTENNRFKSQIVKIN